MIEFVLTNWLYLAIAYGIIYITYVIYALMAKRWETGKRVDERDLQEALGEAFFGPLILPCRVIGNIFTMLKHVILGMVNAGLPQEKDK